MTMAAGAIGIFVVYAVLILLCFVSKLWVRIAICVADCVLPDPVPVADELLMFAGVLDGIRKAVKAVGILRALARVIAIAVVVAIIVAVVANLWG